MGSSIFCAFRTYGGAPVRPIEISTSRFFVLILLMLIVLLGTVNVKIGKVGAVREYARDVPQELKNNCKVCHTMASGGPLNEFGGDYLANSKNIDAVRGMDSDGDGYPNGDELEAGSLPGSPGSYPGSGGGLSPLFLGGGFVLVLAGIALVLRMRR